MRDNQIIPVAEDPAERILFLRGAAVILGHDLARLYGVKTERLLQQVRRNKARFPEDFAFQLTKSERDEVLAKCKNLSQLKHSPSLPYAFTEHGAVMAASVLNSKQAVNASVLIVRAFVQMRRALVANRELRSKLGELEARVSEHDHVLAELLRAIKSLIDAPVDCPQTHRKIGFASEMKGSTQVSPMREP